MAEEGGGDGRLPPPLPPTTTTTISTSFPAAVASSSSQVRQKYTIELKPDETTIVSWKKLTRESNTCKPLPAVEPPSGAHPALESRIAPPPGQPAEGEGKDAPATNRFSAVIEKIERLYVGNESSEEEELANVPDDDQYDTDDSFIDDADLDEYFQVDKSTTKHKGFFVNRGTLERINEHSSSPKDQPKKRRRKDLITHYEDNPNQPNKHAKMGSTRMKTAARTESLLGSKSSIPSQSSAEKSEHYENEKSFNKSNDPVEPSKKKSSDSNIKMEQYLSPEIHRDRLELKDSEQKKTELQFRNLGTKLRVESSEATHLMHQEKCSSTQIDSQSKRLLNDPKELEESTKNRQREMSGVFESSNHSNSKTKNNVQTTKSPSMHSKDGSSVRPKGTMLERAIRDLEDIVKESRPLTVETQDADNSSQGVKRRVPREVKQKLAKVARLAQSSEGKISDELINRLMTIVGHIMQRKTLKRNLKEMVILGLSAKHAKDVKFQEIKKEVVEMIKAIPPSMKSKVSGQQDETCDDFQEAHSYDEKLVPKVNGNMDNALEDKICDLYDLYIEGMDEDKGSQVRKLYMELSELWPNGTMDNRRIKNAICRSKARKRATHNRLKNLEKMKQQKPSSTPRMEDTVRGVASPVAQQRLVQERMATDTSSQLLSSPNRIIANTSMVSQQHLASGRLSHPSTNGSTLNRPKQEMVRGNSGTFLDDSRKTTDQTVVKKKVKRKPESDMHLNPMKLSTQEGKDKHKSHKQDLNHPNKSDLQSSGFSGCEQQFS